MLFSGFVVLRSPKNDGNKESFALYSQHKKLLEYYVFI